MNEKTYGAFFCARAREAQNLSRCGLRNSYTAARLCDSPRNGDQPILAPPVRHFVGRLQ